MRTFSSPEEAIMAREHGVVQLQEEIRVLWNGQLITTTPGRVIFNQILPPMLQFFDRVINHKEMGRMVSECHEHYGLSRAVRLLDDLKELGFRYATLSGLTISITDMDIPKARREQILAETEQAVVRVNRSYAEGLISAGEREDQIFRLWTQAAEQMGAAIMENIDPFNPIFMMANSGARGTIRQVTQLCGMRGLMTDPFGKFIEDLPVKSNFHEGLSVLEYFVSTHGARKGLADTALRTADAGYLTRRLVDVAQDVIVREDDCGTTNSITAEAIREGTEEIESLAERIEGRVAAADIVDPRNGKLILRAGEEIGRGTPPPCLACQGKMGRLWRCESCGMELTQAELEEQAGAIFTMPEDEGGEKPSDEALEQLAERGRMLEEGVCPKCSIPFLRLYECDECSARVASTEVPSPLETIERVAQECLDFFRKMRAVKPGAAAPQTIADPFTGKVVVEARAPVAPEVHSKLVTSARKLEDAGGLAKGQVTIRSPLTCELRQGICALCYGRDLSTGRIVEVGEAVGIIAAQSIGEPGTQLTMRTFHTGGVAAQYLTGVAEVKKKRQETLREIHEDIRRGLVSFEQEVAERERTRKVQQMLKVLEEQVKGLLRVVELFEARRPKGEAIVTEVDGIVHDVETKGVKTLIIHAEIDVEDDSIVGQVVAETVRHPKKNVMVVEVEKEITPQVRERLREAGVKKVKIGRKYMVPYRGYLEVKPGDVLKQGDRLTEGPLDPQKVLKMKGLSGVQEYLLREIQKVYKSQGVDINDKHLEEIIRQMLKKRRIIDPGDTEFLLGQMVDKGKFEDANRRIREDEGQEATAEPVLLGITEASLSTESFLSAASFQKTTKVLTEAAIKGKVDNLIGLKENVIIGRLIPAGTGMQRYRELQIEGPKEEQPLLPMRREEHEEDALLRAIGRGTPGDLGPISASEAERAARGEDKPDEDAAI
jgi:DNA-directed RNA polymerase subunit beta'